MGLSILQLFSCERRQKSSNENPNDQRIKRTWTYSTWLRAPFYILLPCNTELLGDQLSISICLSTTFVMTIYMLPFLSYIKNMVTCTYLLFPIITCPHPTKRPNQQQWQGLMKTPHNRWRKESETTMQAHFSNVKQNKTKQTPKPNLEETKAHFHINGWKSPCSTHWQVNHDHFDEKKLITVINTNPTKKRSSTHINPS